MSNPLISVLLPVYNEEKYLSESINSILNQTYRNFELIIIDDGSTDKSIDIINSYDDSRIILIKNEKNLHIAKSLNKGFKYVNGDFIARIDGNDIAVNTRFEKQIHYLSNHPKCAVVFSPVLQIDENGNSLSIVNGNYIRHELIQAQMFFKNCFYHTAAMMRKTLLPDPPYDESNLSEDYCLWIKLLRDWELHILDEVLMKTRDLAGGLRYSSGNWKGYIRTKLKQLEWLHLYPNRMELNIHLELEAKNRKLDPVLAMESIQWLDKIYLANKRFAIFNEPFFTNKLVEHWNSFVNYVDSPQKLNNFLHILKSPLRKETEKSIFRIIIKFFPYIQLDYYLGILKKVRKFIWKYKIKLISTKNNGLSSTGFYNTKKRFDDQFRTGFWNYLSNLDELGHYSVIVGYCYYWKTDPSILDVGCGEGILWEKFFKNNYSYYEGLDLSNEALNRIKHLTDKKTKFTLTDMLEYSTDKNFDVIVFSESIYFLDDLEKLSLMINKYLGFLKPEGKIIVSQWHQSPHVDKIWDELGQMLILIDKVSLINRSNLKTTIKVYDAP